MIPLPPFDGEGDGDPERDPRGDGAGEGEGEREGEGEGEGEGDVAESNPAAPAAPAAAAGDEVEAPLDVGAATASEPAFPPSEVSTFLVLNMPVPLP